MNIKLSKNWYIRSDKLNVMLVEVKDGRDCISGFYSTLSGALTGYFEQKIRDSKATSVHTLIMELNAIVSALNRALQPLAIEIRRKNEA